MKNNDRHENPSYSQSTVLLDNQKKGLKIKTYLSLGIIIIGIIAIILVVKIGHEDSSASDVSDVIEVNGVQMKLEPAQNQIKSIKDEHHEVEKCIFDSKTITCTDVAGDQTVYQRNYLQDFKY